ncbi:hypothetical protein Tco_0064057 [Tanacetum coccineum]
MAGALESRNKNKYCDFHRDKGHNTNDCLHLKRQIEEAVKSEKLAHLVKEINHGSNKASTSKTVKKAEVAQKDKEAAIIMVQSWGRNVRPRSVIHTLPQMNISFPPLNKMDIEDHPIVICAKVGRHDIHRMCMDWGSASEILYEHCFLRMRLEIRHNLIPAVVLLVGFSGEITWPLRQILLRIVTTSRRQDLSRAGPTSGIRAWREPLLKKLYFYFTMTSQNPSQTYPMPSPSASSFTFPSTTEPVFSASTSEPMEYWIPDSDHNLWNIVLMAQQERIHCCSKRDKSHARYYFSILLRIHTDDFHLLDDARDICWLSKARFGDRPYPDQSYSTTFTTASSNSGWLQAIDESDIKWQMAMLSVRINIFEKKAGRKMKFNNKDAARWIQKQGEDVEIGAAQVYGMIAGAEEDATGNATGDVADDVSNDAAEFALMEAQYKECYIQDLEILLDQMKCLTSLPLASLTHPKDVAEKPLYDRATPIANLPYGMFLTRLYRYAMETYPHLDNGIYDIVDRVMRPLALRQTRRPRSDRGKARHSVSSSSSHHQGTSSHQHDDDDDDDVETSRASTPSPTTYLNSLDSLNYQNYQIPSSSEQTDETLFTRQTTLLNQTQQMHEEMRGGFKSFGKALKGVFSKKKK